MKPRLPDIPGTNLKNVFTLTNLQDALRINEVLDKVERIAIIGAGYVGLEMAECLHGLGKAVHLYERESHVLPGMDADMAQIIEYELQRFGVRLSTSAKVLALVGGENGVAGVKAASGLGIDPADMVLLDWDSIAYPYLDELTPTLDAVVQRAKNQSVTMTMCDGEVIYQHGKFTKVDRTAALKALHDDLSKALADDEVERRKLSVALLPHVRKFYANYIDTSKHQPFYRPSSMV